MDPAPSKTKGFSKKLKNIVSHKTHSRSSISGSLSLSLSLSLSWFSNKIDQFLELHVHKDAFKDRVQ